MGETSVRTDLPRCKDIIIHAGETITPQEVEQISFVRASAAIGVDRGRTEGERVYLMTPNFKVKTRRQLVVHLVRRPNTALSTILTL